MDYKELSVRMKMYGVREEKIEAYDSMRDFYDASEAIEKLTKLEQAMRESQIAIGTEKDARWKYYHKQNKAVCTACSFERDLDENFGKAIACPNCGAKMNGGNKDE